MANQEQNIGSPLQSLSKNCQPRYSYQTNQSILQVLENQTPCVPREEIETAEEVVVNATNMHAADSTCSVPDSTGITTSMQRNNLDSRICHLSAVTENTLGDPYQMMVEDNNVIDSCESQSECSPTGRSTLPTSELQSLELHAMERSAYSSMIYSGREIVNMSMVQIPDILVFLSTYNLTKVGLILPPALSIPFHMLCPTSKGQEQFCSKKIVYIEREDVGLVTDFTVLPLDESKSEHIAVDKANLVQKHCPGHPVVLPYYDFHEYDIYTLCLNIDLDMHLLPCNPDESSQPQNETVDISERQKKEYKQPLKDLQRPADQSEYAAKVSTQGAGKSLHGVQKSAHGAEKFKYGVAVPESHRGPSELELPKGWSAFNALFKNTQFDSIEVLCLSSREVTIGAAVRQQQLSSSQNQSNTAGSLDSEMVHQQMPVNNASSESHAHASRSPLMRSAPRTRTAARKSDACMHQSHARGDEAFVEDSYEIQVVNLTFSAREITQLLHASQYSEIIQQLQNPPSNLPAESFIPTHFIIGVVYFKTSTYKKAREHFRKCAAVAEKANRDGDLMLCNAYLGDMEYASQSYLEAAEYYKKAVKHYASGSVALMFKLTPPSISAIHAKLASAYRNVSMMVQAVQHYQTAISKSKTERDQLSAHTSLGNLYQSMGDNSNALGEYKESIKLAEFLSDHVSLGWAHGNIGNAYLGLNRKDEALHHLHKSLELALEYEQTPQAIGRTYNNLGTAYQSMNDLDKAEKNYDLALSQAIYGNDTAGQARVYGNIGNVHMLRKNYERAIPHYGEVLHLSKDPSTISTAQHNRGCAYYEWATSLQQRCSRDGALKIHGPNCDKDICLSSLSSRSKELYQKGASDLEEVVKYHEERLQHIKGSPSGLTLSVSLFESNSRTFHRLQDCLFNLHMFERALLVAEQSRARTLGELLLKRKRTDSIMRPPLKFDQVTDIVKSLPSPLVYFSYTGARLICWLFLSSSGQLTMLTFDRPLTDDQFDGKSFDYHLRYSLTEKLVEHSFEMYQHIEYDSESSVEVQKLHNLVGEPIQSILLGHSIVSSEFEQVTIVSDSYTALLPLTCLQDPKSITFFGDHYYFNSVPSLLTLGIMNQTAGVTVNLEDARSDFCIVGDPNIPPFKYNDDLWYLGKLPYARREAEWVAHALKTTPVLNEHATKSAFLSRLQRAKIVHIATHGSASAGFLAFAAFALHTDDRKGNTVAASNVLLFPKEIEKLRISPALVVLSSCDSGRGTVKADGIQGMARAFILAGAQSVLTTLWKVPDESASVFMQFFYQYLIKGVQSALALQKAILSVRCFAKYSQYIHWSGYQLTGRDIHFLNTPKPLSLIIQNGFDEPNAFPRLSDMKKLEILIKDPTLPTDVQILKGCPSVNPSEVVKDFISSSYTHFSGGIFWISCYQPEMILASIKYIQKILGTDLLSTTIDGKHQVLFVFDCMTELPNDESLLRILRNSHVHIVAVNNDLAPLNKLIREIDRKLVRGCTIHNIEPLTMIHSTQRMVFNVMEKFDFVPTNADQRVFDQLAELILGSPLIVDTTVQLLIHCLGSMGNKGVQCLAQKLRLKGSDASEINSTYDLFDSMNKLISCCELSHEEQLLLKSLSSFAGGPVPLSLVTEMSQIITQANHQIHLASSLHQKLVGYKLLLQYPLPIIVHPISVYNPESKDPKIELMYVPQHVAQYLWKHMERIDKAIALTIAYCAMRQLLSASQAKSNFVHGTCSLLNEAFEVNYEDIGKDCYQQMHSLYFTAVFNLIYE